MSLPVFGQDKNQFNLLGEAKNFEVNVRVVGKQDIFDKLDINKIDLKNSMVTHLRSKNMRIEDRSSNTILLTLTILEAKNCFTFDIEINVIETVLSAKSYDPGRAAVYSTGSVGYMFNSKDIKNTIIVNINTFLDDLVNEYRKAGKQKKKQ